jgi:hypothetical protein
LAADQFCDQFGKLDEVFAVGNLALTAARGPALVRVEKEQVDIGRIVELAGTELAEGGDAKFAGN